jgi:hypothetical protein
MQKTPNIAFIDSSVRDIELSLNVFIAYEDLSAGKRAKETCDLMSANLGADWQIETQLVSFKALSIPKLRRIAAIEAAKADIVVISCNDSRLPFGLTDWLESLLRGDHRAMAMVALFSCQRPISGQAINAEISLADTASEGRVQFFSRFEPVSAGQWEWTGRQPTELGEWGDRAAS